MKSMVTTTSWWTRLGGLLFTEHLSSRYRLQPEVVIG